MSLKVKLATAISMFILILTILVVGVLSLSPANIPMGGSVNFTATDVYVKITGEIEGAENSSAYADLPALIFSGETEGGQPSESDLQRWQKLDVNFNSSATPIKVKITIENLSTERWLLVNVIEGDNNGGASDNLIREVQKENGAYTLGENHTLNPSTGEGTSKVEFTINLTVDDPNYSVNTVYDYIINLNNSNEAPAVEITDFIFDGNKVTGYTGSETNIIIPSSYSIQEVNITEFIFTEEDYNSLGTNDEALNKLGMLYALKNYTIYPNGQTEGILCVNGFMDAGEYIDARYLPIRVELPEDLTFELTEDEMKNETPDQYTTTTYKIAALQILQNFYVKFGNEPEELCLNYGDYEAKFNERMPDGQLNSTYFPIKVRINYIESKFVEGDDIKIEQIGMFTLGENVPENVTIVIPKDIYIFTNINDEQSAFQNITQNFSVEFEEGTTSISEYAFVACEKLVSVKINGGSNIKIGDYAFFGCVNLASVNLGNNLETKIGDGAFGSCTTLSSVIIPDSVTEIGDRAFASCTTLSSVIIPDSVTEIGILAFADCPLLTYNIDENGNKYLGNENNEFIYLAKVSSVDITSFTFAEGCKFIGDRAFQGCSKLKTLIIPEGIISIGADAFDGCDITTFSVPNSIKRFCLAGDMDRYTTLQSYSDGQGGEYFGNSENNFLVLAGVDNSLTTYKLADGCKVVLGIAFAGNGTVESITIPDSVISIDMLAFDSCTALKSITFEGEIEYIGQVAFYDCTSLESLVIPEGVKSFDLIAITDCSSLKSISFPSTIEEITFTPTTDAHTYTFLNNLESITVAEGNKYYSSDGNCLIEKATKKLIIGCANSVIPNDGTVKIIGQSAFDGCLNLKEITIPNNIFSIGTYAFYRCNNLAKIVVEEGSSLTTSFSDIGLSRTWYKDGVQVIEINGAGTYT